jgi:hypothetical protein
VEETEVMRQRPITTWYEMHRKRWDPLALIVKEELFPNLECGNRKLFGFSSIVCNSVLR